MLDDPQPPVPVARDQNAHKLYGAWIKRTALSLQARMPWADLDELLQWGAIGMLEATKRYDRSLGVDFQAFAARRIRGAMIDGLRREGALRRGEAVFDAETVDSAAYSAGTSPEDPLAQLMRADNRTVIVAALKELPQLEFRVLSLHYYNEMNNREIAAILAISEGYASRIRKRALELLALRLNPQFKGETV
jgi:RNA polymerase sporulation-specific sigma factor